MGLAGRGGWAWPGGAHSRPKAGKEREGVGRQKSAGPPGEGESGAGW